MRRRAVTLVVLSLVVAAGCLAAVEEFEEVDLRPTTGTNPSVATSTGSEAGDDTGSADGRTAGQTRSPWGTDPIVVAVDAPPGRDVAPLVREAAAFWEANATRYAGYTVDYEVRPDAESPDVVVQFRAEIQGCAYSNHTAGCAPYITRPGQIHRPVAVEVRTGLSDASTIRVITHELGHTLGLGHDDAPQEVMRTGITLTTLPRPNATERAFPWADDEFTVSVDVSEAPDPEAARAQVERALEYYERGPPGVPEGLTFRVVDDPDAELVVRYAEESPCTEGAGSCGASRGPDPDGDGASERYSQFTVTVVGVDTDAVGWHTGFWLAAAFGAEAPAEKPPPFRDASYSERRSDWWNESEQG